MKKQNVAVALLAALGTTAALAQEGGADYSVIAAAVSVGGAVTAIVAMGVLKVGPNVASWVTRKLAGFFR